MYKVMAFISRKEGTSREEFRDYYEKHHARLIGEVAPPMRVYRRNYVDLDGPFLRSEEQIDFDVVTEMHFDSQEECQRWFEAFREPSALARVMEDEAKFLDVGRVRVCPVDVDETR